MPREQQIVWNRQSVDGWDAFREHRQRILGLLTDLAPRPSGRLAVMGAGNCNDLDLLALSKSYAEIQLLDWDRDAVVDGVQRQGLSPSGQILIDNPTDLSQAPPPAVASAECVASLGLLSQLMLSVANGRAQPPQQMIAEAAALRRQHFQHMMARMVPGGQGLLSFEFVSSDTLPDLANCSAETVPTVATAAVAAGNFYTGLHPAAVYQTAQQLVHEGCIANVKMQSPWKWSFGPRVYAVTALSFCRVSP